MDQKKQYYVPKMTVVVVRPQFQLMQGSGSTYPGPAGFKYDGEKDYFA